MFALALWDRKTSRGYLARDAFGIKPLYYADTTGEIFFASEVRALFQSGAVERVLSPEGIASFLLTGSVAEPYTIVKGIWALPPGTVAEISFQSGAATIGEPVTFAVAFPPANDEVDSMAQCAFLLRNALRDSVSHHLLSDVPVATFLSGGLDSAALVGIASEVSANPLETFTVIFSETEYSEGDLGRKVAERFSTNHHEVHLGGKDLVEALPSAFAAMDQPSLDGLNTYIVSRAVRSHGIKVALSGLGGDELFGGYPSFRRAARISALWKLPSAVRAVSAFAARGVRGVHGEKIRTFMRSEAPANGAYRASRMLFGERHAAELLGDSRAPAAWEWKVSDAAARQTSLLRQVSIEELTGYMRNTLLRDSDVFSMAHGLELRVPFLDPAVVSVAARAADSLKLRDGSSKPLLARAVEDLIPPDLLKRPKRGFTLPFESWMRADLSSELDAMFAGPQAARIGLSRSAAQRVWSDFRSNSRHVTWSRPWALYTLMRWARENDFAVSAERSTQPERDTAMLASA